MIVYGLTGVTLLIAVIIMWRIAVAVLRRFDGSYEPAHKTPRPPARLAAGAARAGRRGPVPLRRLPGAGRRQQFIDELDAYQDGGGLAYGIVAAPQMSPAPLGTAAAGGAPLVPPPPLPRTPAPVPYGWTHDEYRPEQVWHDQPAVARREATLGSLGAVSAVLLTAAITAEAWRAEVLAPFPRNEPFANCLSEDTIARGELAAYKGGA